MMRSNHMLFRAGSILAGCWQKCRRSDPVPPVKMYRKVGEVLGWMRERATFHPKRNGGRRGVLGAQRHQKTGRCLEACLETCAEPKTKKAFAVSAVHGGTQKLKPWDVLGSTPKELFSFSWRGAWKQQRTNSRLEE